MDFERLSRLELMSGGEAPLAASYPRMPSGRASVQFIAAHE